MIILMISLCCWVSKVYAQDLGRKAEPVPGKIYEKIMHFNTAVEACTFLAQPADLVLIHSDELFAANDLGVGTSILNGIKAILSISDPFVAFSHAEFVVEIRQGDIHKPSQMQMDLDKGAGNSGKKIRGQVTQSESMPENPVSEEPVPLLGERSNSSGPFFHSRNDLVTLSYYPEGAPKGRFNFEVHGKEDAAYRSDFSLYRVKGDQQRREKALERALQYRNYGRSGVCGDFVNWCYGDYITNRFFSLIWILGDLLHTFYVPAAFDSPDDLAESLRTSKICEVQDNQLKDPERIEVREFLTGLLSSLQSKNQRFREHAQYVMRRLINASVINTQGEILVEEVIISHHSAKALNAEWRWQKQIEELQRRRKQVPEEKRDESGEWIIQEKPQVRYRENGDSHEIP